MQQAHDAAASSRLVVLGSGRLHIMEVAMIIVTGQAVATAAPVYAMIRWMAAYQLAGCRGLAAKLRPTRRRGDSAV